MPRSGAKSRFPVKPVPSWLFTCSSLIVPTLRGPVTRGVERIQASGDVGTRTVEQGAVVALDHADGRAHDPRQGEIGTPASSAFEAKVLRRS